MTLCPLQWSEPRACARPAKSQSRPQIIVRTHPQEVLTVQLQRFKQWQWRWLVLLEKEKVSLI